MRKLIGVVAVIALPAIALRCEPPVARQVVVDNPPAPRAEACREDVPDCVAACALRETHRAAYVDFYERRCAAVILGKNPDKVETPVAQSTAAPTATVTAFPPDTRGSLSHEPTPTSFDPSSMPRTGGAEPAECKAARLLRAQKRDREADMMNALCIAKGGDAGA
jgi:hypothetical protein